MLKYNIEVNNIKNDFTTVTTLQEFESATSVDVTSEVRGPAILLLKIIEEKVRIVGSSRLSNLHIKFKSKSLLWFRS
jgi:hypothetical protein